MLSKILLLAAMIGLSISSSEAIKETSPSQANFWGSGRESHLNPNIDLDLYRHHEEALGRHHREGSGNGQGHGHRHPRDFWNPSSNTLFSIKGQGQILKHPVSSTSEDEDASGTSPPPASNSQWVSLNSPCNYDAHEKFLKEYDSSPTPDQFLTTGDKTGVCDFAKAFHQCDPETKVCVDELGSFATEGWASVGESCDLEDQRRFEFDLKNDWISPVKFRQHIARGSTRRKKLCNFIHYFRCEPLSRTCGCNTGSIYSEESGKCLIVEQMIGRCGQTAVRSNMVQDGSSSPQEDINDPRLTAFKYNLECVPGSQCSTGGVCLPSSSSSSEDKDKYLKTYIRERINLSRTVMKWLSPRTPCHLERNFNTNHSNYWTHTQIKENAVELVWRFRQLDKHSNMCNPFNNEECSLKTRKCICSPGFVREEGGDKCLLSPGPHRNQNCRWRGLQGFTVERGYDVGIREVVECVPGAKCQGQGHDDEWTCVCEEGKVCQTWVPGEEEKSNSGRSTYYYYSLTRGSSLFWIVLLWYGWYVHGLGSPT